MLICDKSNWSNNATWLDHCTMKCIFTCQSLLESHLLATSSREEGGKFTQPLVYNFELYSYFYTIDRIWHPGMQRGAGAARVGRAARDLPGQRHRLLLQPRQTVTLLLRGLPRRRQAQGEDFKCWDHYEYVWNWSNWQYMPQVVNFILHCPKYGFTFKIT